AVSRRAGAAVSLWDVNGELAAKTVEELSPLGSVHHVVADISDEAQVDAATATTLREWPRIDILIANAGLTGPNAPTWEYPPDAWRRVVDVNLVGTFYCCRAVPPAMLLPNY